MPVDPSISKQHLEAQWRQRVQDAKLRYDQALADAEAAAPDEASRAQALEALLAARAEHMRVLEIWNELVEHGTLPPE